jgi:TonB family protein
MRRILVASLVLSPILLHAQTNTNLQARSEAPTLTAPAADTGSTSSTAIRYSTGVTAPKVLQTSRIYCTAEELDTPHPDQNTVVVGLLVNEKGEPQDLQIVKSFNERLDERVLAAVQNFRFAPAQLDHQAVPMQMALTVVLQR